MSRDRKRAIALNAADAKRLINSRFSQANLNMTAAQIDQVQKVLDAAVVNPVVQKEYQDTYRKSVIGRVGSEFARDEKIVRKADRIADELIAVSDKDKRIRLNYLLLIVGDPFKPVTDNPDEAAYLKTVAATLESRGVWLRIGQPYVRNPADASSMVIDPRKFDVWLSLGPYGDTISSKDGSLTREGLLGTTTLGAGYYREVHEGPVQRALQKEIRKLSTVIELGLEEHDRLIRRKRDAFVGVAEISDFVGGADLPSRSIWDSPQKLLLKALDSKIGGNVFMAAPLLLVAGLMARNNAQSLATYADKSSAGASSVATILTVVRDAAAIIETGLMVATGVGGLAAMATRRGAVATADLAVEQFISREVAKHPELATEIVEYVRMPKGTTLGARKAGQSSGAGTGFHSW